MAEMTGTKPIEKLGAVIALWGGLAGVLLWVAPLLLRGAVTAGATAARATAAAA